MSRAEELIKQREELDKAIREAVREERKTDLATVKQLCRKHGITYSQVKSALGKGRQQRAR
ncbi:H-NS family nucleoid-associated regulatory protein [Spiribacter insolitus]|uniref:H-NS family nucleoid-associated regulatory protein n=1 Tax=Spiribacter insolitus TaxID=3122417 RepID=A0ABV3T3K5_9GAMM